MKPRTSFCIVVIAGQRGMNLYCARQALGAGGEDRRQHTGAVSFELIFGDTRDEQPLRLEDCFALGVLVAGVAVDGAVQLHDDTHCVAREVYDEPRDHLLAAKMRSGHLPTLA